MEGFVKNVTSEWSYAMKRSVKPGGEIPLKELFEQYGKKHDMKPDEEFVDWLRDIKLRDTNKWKIVFDFKDGSGKEALESIEEQTKISVVSDNISSVAARQLQVEDLVNLTVRKARNVLPKVMDLNLLKYSLTEARQLADKDSLCRLLVKRVKELNIAR